MEKQTMDNRYFEAKVLIEKYLKTVNENQFYFQDVIHKKFIEKLTAYSMQLKSAEKIDEFQFNRIVSTDGCSSKRLYDYLSAINKSLVEIFLRLYNIHQYTRNTQIDGGSTLFEFLVKNASESLVNLGFSLLPSAREEIVEYINQDGIIIRLVNQRLDPPEVWILRQGFIGNLRIYRELEEYFDPAAIIFNGYASPRWYYFNYASFEYYEAFLKKYLNDLTNLGDFVTAIKNVAK